MPKVPYEKLKFIFYIPGSMGSLLSLLIKSQIEKNFVWSGLDGDTAHNYKKLPIIDVHGYPDYLKFKKLNIGIRDYVEKNYLDNGSMVHQISFPGWLHEFDKLKHLNLDLIICYVEDYGLKLFNYYAKKQIPVEGAPEEPAITNSFNINKNNSAYETLTYVKSLNWQIQLEKPYLDIIPTVRIDRLLKKDFSDFMKVCDITNATLLEEIIDLYNKSQKQDFNKLPNDMKRYLKKYQNSI
tara:strand:- start:901 stop:1617 length:717 start_codon:yes stop_codon:yes gene_type:complete